MRWEIVPGAWLCDFVEELSSKSPCFWTVLIKSVSLQFKSIHYMSQATHPNITWVLFRPREIHSSALLRHRSWQGHASIQQVRSNVGQRTGRAFVEEEPRNGGSKLNLQEVTEKTLFYNWIQILWSPRHLYGLERTCGREESTKADLNPTPFSPVCPLPLVEDPRP